MMEKDVSGIFNCGTGKAVNLEDTAQVVAKKYNARVIHEPMPITLRPQYQVFTEADMTKIKEHIELPKFWSVEEYLNDTSV